MLACDGDDGDDGGKDIGGTPTIKAGLYAKTWPITAEDTPIAGVAANNITAAFTHVNANPGTEAAPILYTLLINQDVTSGALYLGSYDSPDVEVTLAIIGIGGERTIQYNGNANESLFTIGSLDWMSPSSGSLTLENNITLKGINNGTRPLIGVDGTLTMKNGSKITGHKSISEYLSAGAVIVAGTFVMDGGEISENDSDMGAGGILVAEGPSHYGTFIMNGGIITGNRSFSGFGVGGVLVDHYTAFTMNDGTITGNLVVGLTNDPRDVLINANATYLRNGGTIEYIEDKSSN